MPPAVTNADKRETSEKREPEGERERGGGVQSIERAVALLTEISRHHGISLADLSRKVGLHTSTTFHLVRTMVELGLVRQERDTKRYHLGSTVYRLAASATGEVELVSTAMPFLEDLAARTKEASHLALRSGHEVIIAAKVAGSGAFQLVERNGSVRPAYCTALGKVLLSALGDAQLRRYVETTPFIPVTSRTVTDPERVLAEIVRVRETGVGYDDMEFDEEVRCVAAPIHDFRGHVVGAVGISGPIWRLTLQRLQDLAGQVKATAADISAELGHVAMERSGG